MKTQIPDFLLEMSRQMNEQDSRATSHPFWQVRCKRFLPVEVGYNEHHWELVDNESGVVYRSDTDSPEKAAQYFQEIHEDWFKCLVTDCLEDPALYHHVDAVVVFSESIDLENEDDFPSGVSRVYVQEVEEVVSTHLTQSDAEWFIKRKQHDYPPLYTYVESAYWSPQLRQLQDWIISLRAAQ